MPRFPAWLIEFVHRLDHKVGWHRLPTPFGIVVLDLMRERLRERNLYDTGYPPGLDATAGERPENLSVRTVAGTWNDLDDPVMGAEGTRFGRNVPLDHTWPERPPRLLTPNPRTVSRELLTREQFIPAETLNLLAAAWLQFEVHDWFSHGANDPEDPIEIPLVDDDPWPERPMEVQRTTRDATADPHRPQTWVSPDSHWWDASQLYGRTEELANRARAFEGGRVRIDEGGLLPIDLQSDLNLHDVYGNHWIGLEMLNTLFSLEHNAICDRLRAEHPAWSDQQLYDRARLVLSALLAKIHTVDWTPAIIAHPTTKKAMYAQWWGLQGEKARRMFGRLSADEAISGIPGSDTEHHGAPYALTEEFVSVYRMHPLLPDDFDFCSPKDGAVFTQHPFIELNALHARERLGECTLENALYSFGVSHPGAIVLHNYPRSLQELERPDGIRMDLGAVDIVRVRERGVPRYTAFRDFFHMKPVRSFEELTPDAKVQRELREVYDNDIDAVDLMVGLYAEPVPAGFGFSDTAFRVFILMASRRLKSDRFFTRDFRPEVYTPEGMQWIADNTMRTVLLRHFPSLAPALEGVENPFAPWNRTPAPVRRQAAAAAETGEAEAAATTA